MYNGARPPYSQQGPQQRTRVQQQGGGAGYGYMEPAGPGGYPANTYPPVPTAPGGGGPAGDEGGSSYLGYQRGYEPSAGYVAGVGGAPDASRAPSGGYGRSQWSQGYGGRGGPHAEATRFAAVRLRGLPFGVRDYEISMFLGLDPVDIIMVHRNGRPTGECIVVLSHPAEVDIALAKNKAYMGSRYIEVFETRKIDYYRAVAENFGLDRGRNAFGGSGYPSLSSPRDRSRSPVPRAGGSGNGGGGGSGSGSGVSLLGISKIVKCRGLPFSASREQIVNFFTDSVNPPPNPEDILIAMGPDGRPNGIAFVEFPTSELAEAALKKDRHLMGSRYIELFLVTEDERARYQPVS